MEEPVVEIHGLKNAKEADTECEEKKTQATQSSQDFSKPKKQRQAAFVGAASVTIGEDEFDYVPGSSVEAVFGKGTKLLTRDRKPVFGQLTVPRSMIHGRFLLMNGALYKIKDGVNQNAQADCNVETMCGKLRELLPECGCEPESALIRDILSDTNCYFDILQQLSEAEDLRSALSEQVEMCQRIHTVCNDFVPSDEDDDEGDDEEADEAVEAVRVPQALQAITLGGVPLGGVQDEDEEDEGDIETASEKDVLSEDDFFIEDILGWLESDQAIEKSDSVMVRQQIREFRAQEPKKASDLPTLPRKVDDLIGNEMREIVADDDEEPYLEVEQQDAEEAKKEFTISSLLEAERDLQGFDALNSRKQKINLESKDEDSSSVKRMRLSTEEELETKPTAEIFDMLDVVEDELERTLESIDDNERRVIELLSLCRTYVTLKEEFELPQDCHNAYTAAQKLLSKYMTEKEQLHSESVDLDTIAQKMDVDEFLQQIQRLRDAFANACNVNTALKVVYTEEESLRQIAEEQSKTDLIINSAAFSLLVREITQWTSSAIQWTSSAVQALQTASEDFLIEQFEVSNILAIHAGRTHIGQEDILLADLLSGNKKGLLRSKAQKVLFERPTKTHANSSV